MPAPISPRRSEEHTSELQSRSDLVCRLLLEKKKNADRLDQVPVALFVVGTQSPGLPRHFASQKAAMAALNAAVGHENAQDTSMLHACSLALIHARYQSSD